MAGKIPPFVIPSLGNSVKNSRVRFFHPPIKITVSRETITKSISNTLRPVRLSMSISLVALFIVMIIYPAAV
jgi:hypothetical protein